MKILQQMEHMMSFECNIAYLLTQEGNIFEQLLPACSRKNSKKNKIQCYLLNNNDNKKCKSIRYSIDLYQYRVVITFPFLKDRLISLNLITYTSNLMALYFRQTLSTNFLWNSMSHADLIQLYDTYQPLIAAVKENNFLTVGKKILSKSYSDPFLGPIIFLGIFPIILSILSLILGFFVNVPVCCCGGYVRYKKVQKRLDKRLMRCIKANNIPYKLKRKKGEKTEPMFDVCAEAGVAQSDDVEKLNRLHEQSDKLYLRAFKCECWTLSCYVLFFILLITYIAAAIVLALGVKDVTQLPTTIYSSTATTATKIMKELQSVCQNFDSSINDLIDTKNQPINVFQSLLTDNQVTYESNIQKVKENTLQLKLLKPAAISLNELLERNTNTNLNNQKSLARWLENIIFWPNNYNVPYVQNGNAAGKSLHGKIYELNNDVYKINQNVKYITSNVSEFPQDIQNNIDIKELKNVSLGNISELINNSQAATQNGLVEVVKLLEKQNLNKYVFANALIKAVKDQISGSIQITDEMIQVFINKTLNNGQLVNVDRKKPLWEIMQPLLGNDIINWLNGQTILNKIANILDNNNIFISFSAYQPFIHSLNRLQNLTVDQFLNEISSKSCDDFWCGILPDGTFQQINEQLKQIPVVGNMLAYKQGPSELLVNAQPLVIALCTLIPIIIIISLTISMACCKSCCPICSIFSCSVCSILVSIISAVLLIISFANSGVIQSVAYKMMNDNIGLLNAALKIGRDMKIITQENITLSLPSNDFLTLEPSQLIIPLTNVSAILSSIKITSKLNTQMSNQQISNILQTIFPDGFNLTVSLENMDINKLFASRKSKSILELIKGQNGTLLNDLENKITEIINKISLDTVSKIVGDQLNLTSKFDIDSIMNQVNIDNIFTQLEKTNFSKISSEIQSALTTVSKFMAVETQQADQILFNKITKQINDSLNNNNGNGSGSGNVDIVINGSTNLNLLDQVYLNLILQFLSEQSNFGGITNVTQYYQDSYTQVQNRNYSVYDQVLNSYCKQPNGTFEQFGKYYSSINCNQQATPPNPPTDPSLESKFNESMKNRGVTIPTSSNTTSQQIVMCEVTQNLIKADKFNYKSTNTTYNICNALNEVKKTRNAMYNIQTSMSGIKGTVEVVANEIDKNIQGSFASTAQTNLKTFLQSVLDNIGQTTLLKPSTTVTTIYDVINNTGLIDNVKDPLNIVKQQLIFLLQNVLTTGVTSIVPSSISSLGNGALSGFDNLSIAAYFGFLFYFIGCQISICFALYFIRRYDYERYIKKRYKVRRPRFNCCGSAFKDVETRHQTKHQKIIPKNALHKMQFPIDKAERNVAVAIIGRRKAII